MKRIQALAAMFAAAGAYAAVTTVVSPTQTVDPACVAASTNAASATSATVTSPANLNQRFGKVWLLPYNTGKDGSKSYPEAYTWYDDLIISRQKIADPR